MNRTANNGSTVLSLIRLTLVATVLLASCGDVFAQVITEKDHPAAWMEPGRIQNLEHVRKLNEFGPFGVGYGISGVEMDVELSNMGGLSIMGMEGPMHDPPLIQQLEEMRQQSRMKIDQIRKKLRDPKTDRSSHEERLKSALQDYFVVDMRCRVMELDEIKAKLAQTEAKLLKRLEAKDDAIDLQLQIMIREADGLGFFPKDDATSPLNSQPGVLGSQGIGQ